jgi:UDP-N-acetylmuramoyl-tripeptide--D-alanyl-D-alanine ligase
MRPTDLAEIVAAVGGKHVSGKAATPKVIAVSTDSRTAKAGELFVAIAGENFDGHAFLPQAAAAGCVAAIVAAKAALPPQIAASFSGGLITVEDTLKALGDLAAWHRRANSTKVVAVTGSNGKTTVKMMIHHILSRRFRGSCGPKSFNNNIGVPLTLLAAGAGDDYVVCEIGSNAPGEIAALAAIAAPDVAVITSIGPTHLEKLISVEKVAVEKASILRHLAADGLAIVPTDSPELDKALRPYKVNLVRFGEADGAEFRLTGYEPAYRTGRPVGAGGTRFEVNGQFWVALPLPGRHNALNALAAIAVANHFGISPAQAAEAMAEFSAAPMRLERIELGGVTIINDAYNANPASVAAAAEVLSEALSEKKIGRKVMIVGDMRELGPQAFALHAQTGAWIAARAVDLLVCVGELGRYIALGAADGGLEAVAFDTVDQAAEALPKLLRAGDVVLIKGSRAMGMERLIEPIRAAFGPRPPAKRPDKK